MPRILCLILVSATLAACSSPEPTPSEAETESPSSCPHFTLAARGLPDVGEWRTHPSIGDVNGDGLDDIAALARKTKGPQVFLSDGLGGWAEASEGLKYKGGFSCGIGTRLVDLNGDDLLDLVVADHCTGVTVYRGDGGTAWTEMAEGIPRNAAGFNDAAVGDLDGDGVLDIVAVSAFTRGFMVVRGLADGTWNVVEDTGLPNTGGGWQLQLVDVNGDERLDVVSTYNPVSTDRRTGLNTPAKVFLQNEDGRFRPTEGFPTKGRFFGVDTWVRADRRVPTLFFALAGALGGLYQYESPEGEHWTQVARVDAPWKERDRDFAGIKVADIDGDGCLDMLMNEAHSRSVLLALGDCEGGWSLCPEDTFDKGDQQGSGWGIASGDFNGDGRADVVSGYGTARGGLMAWYQTNAPQEQD